MAAPVLVLRPPGGVHHGAAGLRDHLGGRASFCTQANLWIRRHRCLGHRHRVPIGQRLGPPHVHGRPGRCGGCVLWVVEHDHRRTDGDQGFLLARDTVGRPHSAARTDAVRARLHRAVHRWRIKRGPLRYGASGLAGPRYVLRGGAFSLCAGRRLTVRDPGRDLLLVPQNHGPLARRAPRAIELLVDGGWLQPGVLSDAHHRIDGSAAADLYLPRLAGLGCAQLC